VFVRKRQVASGFLTPVSAKHAPAITAPTFCSIDGPFGTAFIRRFARLRREILRELDEADAGITRFP
jgi:hypothetical protein